MDFSVASVEGGIAKLVNLKEFDSCSIPTNLLPSGVKSGQMVTISVETRDDFNLEEKVLKLQDDISVYLRSRQ